MTKATIDEVRTFLRRNDAVLVHFSGFPHNAKENSEARFPGDLKRLFEKCKPKGLACSVVAAKDNDTIGPDAAWGHVGVILDLVDENSLASVHIGDGGSVWRGDCCTPREFDENECTLADIENSLANRQTSDGNTYNEYGVRTYRAIAMLMIEPYGVHGVNGDRTTIEEVAREFGLDIYTFKNGKLYMLHPEERVATVSEIYT